MEVCQQKSFPNFPIFLGGVCARRSARTGKPEACATSDVATVGDFNDFNKFNGGWYSRRAPSGVVMGGDFNDFNEFNGGWC